MNTKRIFFWIVFVVILVLIIWGLIVAMNKPATSTSLGAPAAVTLTDHIRGPVNAPVTLIEYGDFQCPACGLYYPLVERLYSESSSTLRMVFRHFPLQQHVNAIPAAKAAEAASLQGKFWEMYDLLYQNQKTWSDVGDTSPIFATYAQQLGLNLDRFKTDSASSTILERITTNQDEGIRIGINQTPTFFVNNKAITNPQSYDEFKTIIDAAASSSAK